MLSPGGLAVQEEMQQLRSTRGTKRRACRTPRCRCVHLEWTFLACGPLAAIRGSKLLPARLSAAIKRRGPTLDWTTGVSIVSSCSSPVRSAA